MARTSYTTLNKSGESGHPCLVPDLRENAFSFSPLSMMLAVGLSYMAFMMFVHYLKVSGIPFSLKPDFEHQMGFVLQQISGNPGGYWKLIPRFKQRLPSHLDLLPMPTARSPLLSEYRNGEGVEALFREKKSRHVYLATV